MKNSKYPRKTGECFSFIPTVLYRYFFENILGINEMRSPYQLFLACTRGIIGIRRII